MADAPTSHDTSSSPTQQRGPLRRFLRKAIRNWRDRHRLPFNFAIHMFGIPIAMVGLVCLFIWPWWGLAGLVVGYALQYIGHLAEGNDLGEWAGIKRLLGLPYVGISPRWQQQDERVKLGK